MTADQQPTESSQTIATRRLVTRLLRLAHSTTDGNVRAQIEAAIADWLRDRRTLSTSSSDESTEADHHAASAYDNAW
jgi:hypothetical protein